jgi:hypothetical protein
MKESSHSRKQMNNGTKVSIVTHLIALILFCILLLYYLYFIVGIKNLI